MKLTIAYYRFSPNLVLNEFLAEFDDPGRICLRSVFKPPLNRGLAQVFIHSVFTFEVRRTNAEFSKTVIAAVRYSTLTSRSDRLLFWKIRRYMNTLHQIKPMVYKSMVYNIEHTIDEHLSKSSV